MISIGTDIEEVAKIEKLLENPRFLTRFFSKDEISYFASKHFAPTTVCGNFCAKEALSKALGTGIRDFALKEISVLRDEKGCPYFMFEGAALAAVASSNQTFKVSISHTKKFATATVIGFI